MDHLQVPFVLTVAQINQILNVLGRQPYIEVVDTINAIKQQGDLAVDDARRKLASVESIG